MLTNFDLEELCDVYNVPLHGIYMKDMLPNKIQNGNYIINLESSYNGRNNGTHWTCLVVNNKECLFYDPYGAPPSLEIRHFVRKRRNAHLGLYRGAQYTANGEKSQPATSGVYRGAKWSS